jgi:hypothetical protein
MAHDFVTLGGARDLPRLGPLALPRHQPRTGQRELRLGQVPSAQVFTFYERQGVVVTLELDEAGLDASPLAPLRQWRSTSTLPS